MKRWGLLAAAALLSIGTALAEEEPSRHIRTTISGEAYAVAVDAGVYGGGAKGCSGLSGYDARSWKKPRRI